VRSSGDADETAALFNFRIEKIFRKAPSRTRTDCKDGTVANALCEFVRARRSISGKNFNGRSPDRFARGIGRRSDCARVRSPARESQRSKHVTRRYRGYRVASFTKATRPRGIVDLSPDQMHARHPGADCSSNLGKV